MVFCELHRLLGCEYVKRDVSSIEKDYNTPPKRTACSICGKSTEPKVMKDDKWLSCCFLPICVIPVESHNYLVCGDCGSRIVSKDMQKCENCYTDIPGGYNYCSHCGIKMPIKETKNGNKK